MAVLQSKLEEIRYLKRQNLEEESKMIGNMYRDIIRQYGVDCNYYKIKIPYLEKFKKIIDDNVLILHAYGQDSNPDYSISSDMLTYMEVENDIFQLNKYGVIPNMDVNFYFDSTDFACALAYKLGQLKEYPIKEQFFAIEVPEVISDFVTYDTDGDGNYILTSLVVEETEISDYSKTGGYNREEFIELSSFDILTHNLVDVKRYTKEEFKELDLNQDVMFLSDDVFPYGIGYGFPETYESEILTGRFEVKIEPYELDKEYTVLCHPYEHDDVAIRFPANDTIYKSFEHVIDTKEFVDQMLFLTYKVSKVKTGEGYKFILKGHLHGSILFHDLTKVGKYMEMIHPDVGDIVTIDFPDENNRQQFEITDCYDKNLTNDGINPLLHKYVWKCKARRYINSGEDFPEKNEGNERWEEKIDFLNNADEEVAKQIGEYDEENNDAVYGGYEREPDVYDKEAVDSHSTQDRIFLDDGSFIELIKFHDNSKLITDGYELYFIDTNNIQNQITLLEEKTIKQNLIADGIQYLKATDNALYFVNFDNRIQRICEDDNITQGEIEMCLNSLIDTTYSTGDQNKDGDCYYKFTTSNTVLISISDHLYCRFGNKEHKMIRII